MTTEDQTTEWVSVPREIAERHPLYGIGGWMILVILRCASIPFTLGPALVQLYPIAVGADRSDPLFTYVLIEFPILAILVLWAIGNLFLIFARHRLFPSSYIGYLLLLTLYVLIDAYFNSTLALSGDAVPSTHAASETLKIIGLLIGTGIWIGYAVGSLRVNVTFLGRVRANDPVLRQTIADIF